MRRWVEMVENIVVRIDGKEVGRCPIHILEQIVCFNYTGMNSALLKLCVQRESVCHF